MCGIVGYVGQRPAQEILLAGLEKLEYRGYDSAGVSVLTGGEIASVRAVGNLSKLREAVAHGSGGADPHESGPAVAAAVAVAEEHTTSGIGHTRWATHGRVTESNAHPHFDTNDRVHVVVNGIVENYLVLKQRMTDMGADYTSETDAEVIAHLISHHMALGSLTEAVCAAYDELEGHYAFVAMSADEPGTLVGCAQGVPADRRPRRGRAVPRLRRSGLPRPHARRAVHRERRDRRAARRRRAVPHARRHAAGTRDHARRLGRGDRREGRLRDVHAQGDPRAGRRGRRDRRRPHRARHRRRPRRGRARRVAAAERRPDPHPRRRHVISRRADRALRDRGVGAHSGRHGHRVGVALPQPDRLRARARHRHHAVRGDRRHARRHAPRAGARREGARLHERRRLAGHARRRRRALHARRPRGVGRRDEDVRLPGRGDVPARAAPRRAARNDGARAHRRARRGRSSSCPRASRSSSIASTRRSRPPPSATRTPSSTSTSAATWAARWRSRAR